MLRIKVFSQYVSGNANEDIPPTGYLITHYSSTAECPVPSLRCEAHRIQRERGIQKSQQGKCLLLHTHSYIESTVPMTRSYPQLLLLLLLAVGISLFRSHLVNLHPFPAHGFHSVNELPARVQCLNIVAAAYTPRIDQDVWHGSPACNVP